MLRVGHAPNQALEFAIAFRRPFSGVLGQTWQTARNRSNRANRAAPQAFHEAEAKTILRLAP